MRGLWLDLVVVVDQLSSQGCGRGRREGLKPPVATGLGAWADRILYPCCHWQPSTHARTHGNSRN